MTVPNVGHAIDRDSPEPAKVSGGWKRLRPADVGVALLLWGYAAIVIGPLLLVVLNTMRTSREIFRNPVGLPTSLNFDSYVRAWEEASFNIYFLNSPAPSIRAASLSSLGSCRKNADRMKTEKGIPEAA